MPPRTKFSLGLVLYITPSFSTCFHKRREDQINHPVNYTIQLWGRWLRCAARRALGGTRRGGSACRCGVALAATRRLRQRLRAASAVVAGGLEPDGNGGWAVVWPTQELGVEECGDDGAGRVRIRAVVAGGMARCSSASVRTPAARQLGPVGATAEGGCNSLV
jgi:hypothetical protein